MYLAAAMRMEQNTTSMRNDMSARAPKSSSERHTAKKFSGLGSSQPDHSSSMGVPHTSSSSAGSSPGGASRGAAAAQQHTAAATLAPKLAVCRVRHAARAPRAVTRCAVLRWRCSLCRSGAAAGRCKVAARAILGRERSSPAGAHVTKAGRAFAALFPSAARIQERRGLWRLVPIGALTWQDTSIY